ncbi:TPA: hypothetical protein P0E24_002498 [Vibrio campbellii]|uniref:hypothetical protein n=1 Tax=Vibrio sp. M260121 TaxID=3020897 RepID=UPI002F3E892E|nr:hypothetical protein [Vibrio campbellii]HDM8243412.1 hypothetical protein [Vibrio campbellii]
MSNNQSAEISDTQRELEALRERLRQNTQTMQSSAKKSDANEMMSGVIKTVATFEKD